MTFNSSILKRKKTITADLPLMREINKTLIFEAIRSHSPVSRAMLGKMLGLVRATVSSLVNDLIEQKLVYEIGLGQSNGGRKPIMLMFNPAAGHVIAVDIRADSLHVALTDLSGAILTRQMSELKNYDVDTVLRQLKRMLKALMKSAAPSHYGIIGIGIGFPGLVSDDGEILFAPTLRWENVPLARLLADMLGIPVSVYNEARAGAMGETHLGSGKAASDLVYVSIGPGVGTGIIMNNELYKGCQSLAGEAGHMLIQHPRDGSLEWQQVASVKSLLFRAQDLPVVKQAMREKGLQQPTLAILLQLASQKHPEVITLFADTGRAIGLGIVNLMHLLNPDLIIIGGEMAEAKKWLQEPLHEFVRQHAIARYAQQIDIRFSPLGNNATLQGAASLVIEQMFGKTRVTVD